ncbi:ulp1 protease family, C-terminal catalytic domain-containing protein [Artemisia annua]|uniref:Ulp1 protease family, C-terminal catalytic domain-containing protein n=1 Tax=Artemisia annua TaxID=35608 RepID=A0A2U1P9J4_ARTAN|nr:ulp1 protease family, C-terminal catalytic domain-containing protein [Artemisia annua]
MDLRHEVGLSKEGSLDESDQNKLPNVDSGKILNPTPLARFNPYDIKAKKQAKKASVEKASVQEKASVVQEMEKVPDDSCSIISAVVSDLVNENVPSDKAKDKGVDVLIEKEKASDITKHKDKMLKLKFKTTTKSSETPILRLEKPFLAEIGFSAFYKFDIDYIPSRLGRYVVENFDEKSCRLMLENEKSIEATVSKVHDLLGIPIGGVSLLSLETRPVEDKFEDVLKSQFEPKKFKQVRVNDIALKLTESRELLYLDSTNYKKLPIPRTRPTIKQWSSFLMAQRQDMELKEEYSGMSELYDESELPETEGFVAGGSSDSSYKEDLVDHEGSDDGNGDDKKDKDAKERGDAVPETKVDEPFSLTQWIENHLDLIEEWFNCAAAEFYYPMGVGIPGAINPHNIATRAFDASPSPVKRAINPHNIATRAFDASPSPVKRLVKPSSYLLSPYMNKKTRVEHKMTRPEFILGNSIFAMQGEKLERVFETRSGELYSVRLNMETLAPGLEVDANVIDCLGAILNHENSSREAGCPLRHFSQLDTITMFDGTLESEYEKFEEFEKEISAQFKDDVGGLALNGVELKTLFARHLKLYGHNKHASIHKVKPRIASLKWKTKNNFIDCGVFTMLHMDNYTGEAPGKWDCGLVVESKEQSDQLRVLRFKFATKILLHKVNVHAGRVYELALEFDKLPPGEKLSIILSAVRNRDAQTEGFVAGGSSDRSYKEELLNNLEEQLAVISNERTCFEELLATASLEFPGDLKLIELHKMVDHEGSDDGNGDDKKDKDAEEQGDAVPETKVDEPVSLTQWIENHLDLIEEWFNCAAAEFYYQKCVAEGTMEPMGVGIPGAINPHNIATRAFDASPSTRFGGAILNHENSSREAGCPLRHFFPTGCITITMFDGTLESEDEKFEEFEKEILAQFKDDKTLFARHLKLYGHNKHASIRKVKPRIASLKWKTKNNFIDCGVFTMLYMDNYTGEAPGKWDCGLVAESKEQSDQLRVLRFKFATKILLQKVNVHAGRMYELTLEFDKLPPGEKLSIILSAVRNRDARDRKF